MDTIKPRSIEHNLPLADGEEVVTHARTRTLVASIGAPWVPVVIQLAEGSIAGDCSVLRTHDKTQNCQGQR